MTATYANGASGVGATLTNSGVQAAFSVDGVSPPINSRILVKNQASTFQNGCYTLTTVGSGASNWVLTRALDYDSPSEIVPGTMFIVLNGSTLTSSGWIETATVATVGTDPVVFAQNIYSPTLFLQVANNLSELTGTAATARTNIGLGTIATQDANSVAITGGTIDGAAVGGVTPAAVTATVLAATGITNLGSGQIVKSTVPGAYPYNILTSDFIIYVDTSAARTIRLPDAPTKDFTWIIKDNVGSATANPITVTTVSGVVTIDGDTSKSLNFDWGSWTITFNGTSFRIV